MNKVTWICPKCLGRNGCMCALKPKPLLKKYYNDEKYILFCLWLVVLLGAGNIIFSLVRKQSVLEARLRVLETTHIHQWFMDSSCSDQLMNSDDHTLRIKLK